MQAALGAATTQIQNAINAAGRLQRVKESDAIHKDTQYQIIHDLLDDAAEQYIIMMHERDLKLPRRRNVFDSRNRYEFWKNDGSGGKGGFSVDDLCKKLPNADLLTVDLRDQVSLAARGHEYAKWLIERGHKAAFFECELGTWSERPTDAAAVMALNPHVDQPPDEEVK